MNNLVQKVLGEILLREYDFGKHILITITRVEATPNLQEARIYITVIPEEKQGQILKILSRNVYHIQQELNERLRMRPVPRIKWLIEKGTAQAQRVEELLEEIKRKEQ